MRKSATIAAGAVLLLVLAGTAQAQTDVCEDYRRAEAAKSLAQDLFTAANNQDSPRFKDLDSMRELLSQANRAYERALWNLERELDDKRAKNVIATLVKLDKDMRRVFSAVSAWQSHVDAPELSEVSTKLHPTLRVIRDARNMVIDVACR